MRTFIILVTLFGTFLSAAAQDPNKILVNLNISGKSGLEGEVRSYFMREFRTIEDVEVTDAKAVVAVNIVILETRTKAGQSTGYAISLAITDKTPILTLAFAGASLTTDPEKQKQIAQYMPEGGILVDHIIQVLDTESLAKSCKQLAAQIDGTHLENVRKMKRELQKWMQNQQKK